MTGVFGCGIGAARSGRVFLRDAPKKAKNESRCAIGRIQGSVIWCVEDNKSTSQIMRLIGFALAYSLIEGQGEEGRKRRRDAL